MLTVIGALSCVKKVEIKGHIKDDNNKPLSGVVVSIKGIDKTILSDENGDYSVSIPFGKTALLLNKTGYFPNIIKLDITSNEKFSADTVIINEIHQGKIYHTTDSIYTEMERTETIYKSDQFWGMSGTKTKIQFNVNVKEKPLRKFPCKTNLTFISSEQIEIVRVSNPDSKGKASLGSLQNYASWRNAKISFIGKLAGKSVDISSSRLYKCILNQPTEGMYAVVELGGNMNAAGVFENTYPHLFSGVYLFEVFGSPANYLNGQLHGAYQIWYKDGQQQENGSYNNGGKDGLWTHWEHDGQKTSETTYLNGQLHGAYQIWYKDGQQQENGSYNNGGKDGLWISWNESGQKKSEIGYVNGRQSGVYRTWHDNGQQAMEGVYKDGQKDGKWLQWYDNGQKKKELVFVVGKLEGGENYWTEDGRKFNGVIDIDGNNYPIIKIGSQWWMAENLKVTHYRNGEPISKITSGNDWKELSSGSYCEYDNKTENSNTYGHLYNWYAVSDSLGIAPEGWHVPTDDEWKQLEMYLGMSKQEVNSDYLRGSSIGGKLKEAGYTHWRSHYGGATNRSKFSAIPGGSRNSDGDYFGIGGGAIFWSSTESGGSAWIRELSFNYSTVKREDENKHNGYSVRLVRD